MVDPIAHLRPAEPPRRQRYWRLCATHGALVVDGGSGRGGRAATRGFPRCVLGHSVKRWLVWDAEKEVAVDIGDAWL